MEKPQNHLDVARRTIYLVGEVDEALSARILPALELLDSTEGDIRIVINSEGGNEADGYAIYDAITMCKNVVVIDVYGQCLSIAAAIFQAGDVRRMAPNSSFMIHNGSIGVDPEMKQDEVKVLAEQIKRDTQKYYDILSAATQHPQEVIENWCNDETYFTAKEAKDAGFCDEIMKPLKSKNRPRRRRKKS